MMWKHVRTSSYAPDNNLILRLPRHVQVSLLHLGWDTVGFSQYSSDGSILFDIPNVHADSYSGLSPSTLPGETNALHLLTARAALPQIRVETQIGSQANYVFSA